MQVGTKKSSVGQGKFVVNFHLKLLEALFRPANAPMKKGVCYEVEKESELDSNE